MSNENRATTDPTPHQQHVDTAAQQVHLIQQLQAIRPNLSEAAQGRLDHGIEYLLDATLQALGVPPPQPKA